MGEKKLKVVKEDNERERERKREDGGREGIFWRYKEFTPSLHSSSNMKTRERIKLSRIKNTRLNYSTFMFMY